MVYMRPVLWSNGRLDLSQGDTGELKRGMAMQHRARSLQGQILPHTNRQQLSKWHAGGVLHAVQVRASLLLRAMAGAARPFRIPTPSAHAPLGVVGLYFQKAVGDVVCLDRACISHLRADLATVLSISVRIFSFRCQKSSSLSCRSLYTRAQRSHACRQLAPQFLRAL